jgi:hypothetical protein
MGPTVMAAVMAEKVLPWAILFYAGLLEEEEAAAAAMALTVAMVVTAAAVEPEAQYIWRQVL